MDYKIFESSEKNVWKYVFSDNEKVLETVLYKYDSFEKRTVICCSVQSGCPVGCKFCGTGKKFITNIDYKTIIEQIETVLENKDIDTNKCEKFQIMFMSMGEPMLNWKEVEKSIIELNIKYPNADLLLSTIGVNDDEVFDKIISLSARIDKVGLQFSIHKSNDKERDILIPYSNKYSLRALRDRAIMWNKITGRKVYLNYCVGDNNYYKKNIEELKNLFTPIIFNFTFSVICDSNKENKEYTVKNLERIKIFEQSFLCSGYNTRIFDPAGQDDIGGGCGQLWFVQEFMKGIKK